MAESRADRRGGKREGQRAKHVSAAGRLQGERMAASFGSGGRSRLVWNDVNVEIRGECYELFYERFAAEEGLTDAAVLARAPHDDLRNTRQARELGDLKRDVVAIDGFHMCSELLG